jgi:hypothetical protein
MTDATINITNLIDKYKNTIQEEEEEEENKRFLFISIYN